MTMLWGTGGKILGFASRNAGRAHKKLIKTASSRNGRVEYNGWGQGFLPIFKHLKSWAQYGIACVTDERTESQRN